MATAGVIGIGDMGSGLAKNLLAAGFDVVGRDVDPVRQAAFADMGGRVCASAAEVGAAADAVFVMVMTGAQARAAILGDGSAAGDGGLVSTMSGGVIILSATILPSEAREIAAALAGGDVALVDSPVSGGFPGAQSGTLTMMAAGTDPALAAARPAMEAVSATIHRVGDAPGMGQTVKACLQSLMGSILSATFEAAVLAAKAGVDGQVLHDVATTSSAGCGLVKAALENIIARRFEGTGSHIDTMRKDLTIALDLGRDLGVPLFTASTAMQLFEAGRTKHPEGDNWVVTKVLEDIVGAELHRSGGGGGGGGGGETGR